MRRAFARHFHQPGIHRGERESVCVCVCVSERVRACVRACFCVRESVHVCALSYTSWLSPPSCIGATYQSHFARSVLGLKKCFSADTCSYAGEFETLMPLTQHIHTQSEASPFKKKNTDTNKDPHPLTHTHPQTKTPTHTQRHTHTHTHRQTQTKTQTHH